MNLRARGGGDGSGGGGGGGGGGDGKKWEEAVGIHEGGIRISETRWRRVCTYCAVHQHPLALARVYGLHVYNTCRWLTNPRHQFLSLSL